MKDRIRQIRESIGITQETMSQRLGLGDSTWQKYELGISQPNSKALIAISDLGFSIDWILTGEGEMRRDAKTVDQVDSQLLGRCAEAVGRLYKELNIHLQEKELGEMAAEAYDDIKAGSDDKEEHPAILKGWIAQRRRTLQKELNANTQGKRSA